MRSGTLLEQPVPNHVHIPSHFPATAHLRGILEIAVEHVPAHQSVVVSDKRSPLACLLADGYAQCLPSTRALDFDDMTLSQLMDVLGRLRPGDLVVMLQSTSFRLEDFRIRVELFKRGLKVIEHPRLARMKADEYETYFESLAYDPSYYRRIGPALKRCLDGAETLAIETGGGNRLECASPLESARLNVGDYAGMANIGGQFPIGEVFTESKDLEAVNGSVQVFAFGDTSFCVNVPEQPLTLTIRSGKVVDVADSTPAFDSLLTQIRADEEPWIREVGFGLNRAFTRDRRVSDVGTYERMCGVHLSLGAKHGMYAKPQLKRNEGKYHIDLFVSTTKVLVNDTNLFEDNQWCP